MAEYGSGDEDDGFDPAFDLPGSPGSDSLGASLGAGFGQALSDRDEDPLSDPSSSSWGHHHASTSSLPSTASSLGDALGRAPAADEDALATSFLLRRSRGAGSGAPASNRLSLAFELASASTTGHANRDLMRELGIEEDEEPDDGFAPGEEEEEEDGPEAGKEEDSGYGAEVLINPRAGGHSSDPSSSPGRPSRPVPSASDALAPSSVHSSPGRSKPEQTVREEADASFREATRALESALEMTGLFLAHLRQHTTNDAVDPSLVPPALRSVAEPVLDYTDRQPVLEMLASSVIKSMYDLSKQREAQTRELAELERIVFKPEMGWQAPLGEVAPPREGQDHLDGREGDEEDPYVLATPSSALAASARVELSNLRDATTSLISSLSALNEVTQVNRAGVGDAGRKLKALRGHLGTVKDDLQSVARSEDFIREYERRGGRKGRYAEQAREAVRGAQIALDEGWTRAQQVLATA